MKRHEPRLDKHGFPIPPDFDAAGVDRPGGRADGDRFGNDRIGSDGEGSGSSGRWLLRLLKLGVFCAVLTAVWFQLELNVKFRNLAGRYYAQQAVERLRAKDLDGALHKADQALSWSPSSVPLLLLRAKLLHVKSDHVAALSDIERAVEIKPNDEEAQRIRSALLYRLHRHPEAAAAATEMLERRLGDVSESLNTRAYARALGGFELDEALTDIDRALAERPDNASFLDTRAYVLFKLGRHQEALDDLEKAIALTEKERDAFERGAPPNLTDEAAEFRAERKTRYDENLAVMYFHRGEVQETLGNVAEAKKDRFIGLQHGYDPAAGVY